MTIAERDQQEQFEKDILDDKPASRMLAAVDKANPPDPLACFMLPNSTIVGSMKAGEKGEIGWTLWQKNMTLTQPSKLPSCHIHTAYDGCLLI